MKKLLFLLIFLPGVIYSQAKTITGTVKEKNGLPLQGVSVLVKNSKNLATTTDLQGSFSINIPANQRKVLVFSYVGYITEEVNVSTNAVVKVELIPSQTKLEEVVVIGYGTVLKKDVTGSVTSVKVKDDVANQSNSIEQLLQGRAAGVQVIQNSGSLGSGISVKIRGNNSLRGNNEPLYVVDGVIISSAGEDVPSAGGIGNSGQEAQNGLNGITPRDIESIEVLKDASATAIYGSRGASGVVLITTKKGKAGKVKINTFVINTVRSIEKKYDVLDGVTFAKYQNEAATNTLTNVPFQINGSEVFGINYPNNVPTVATAPSQIINWQDELYQQGFGTKVGFSASGGSEKGNYYISGGYDGQEGIADNSSIRSIDFRINVNQELTKNLKLEAKASAFFNKTNFAEGGDLIGSSNQSFIRNVISFRPIIPATILDFGEELEASNPFSWIEDFEDKSKESRFIGSLGLIYTFPIKGLSYDFRVNGDIRTKDRRRFFGLTTYNGANANGALQISTLNSVSFQINNVVKYNRTFKNKHRINATVGLTYDVRNVQSSIYAVEDFVTTELTVEQPFLGSVITQPLLFLQADNQIFSTLGRLIYTFNDKYIFTGSYRRDGVSKFKGNNKFGSFPSFALAWRLDKEKIIEKLKVFEDFKLRAGWGQIGNHGIGPYGTLSNYGINGALYGTPTGGTAVPLTLNNIANPTLNWERTEQVNLGLDFGLKNKRISGSIEAYSKTSKNLLQISPVPTSSGFNSIPVNRGLISNKGMEISLNSNIVSNDNFQVSIGGNISFNKTQIQQLGIPLKDFYIDGVAQKKSFYFGETISRGNIFKSPANVFIEGQESGLFYGFATNGIYQTGDTDLPVGAKPGDVRIVDQNNDKVINLNDRTFIGNPNPDFFYGFNFSFKYKRFSADFLFNGVYGNDIANGNLLQLDNAEGFNGNILPAAYNNAWRPNAQSNTHPRIGYTTDGAVAITDRIIEDGSYLRLNNATISYDFPLEKNLKIERLNIYIAGQNLFTWTNYSGYNPEISSFLYTGLIKGVDWNGAPNARTISVGLNINF